MASEKSGGRTLRLLIRARQWVCRHDWREIGEVEGQHFPAAAPHQSVECSKCGKEARQYLM